MRHHCGTAQDRSDAERADDASAFVRDDTARSPSIPSSIPSRRPNPTRSPHNYCDQSRTSFTRFAYAWAGEPYVSANSAKLVPARFLGKRLAVPATDGTFSGVPYAPEGKNEPYTGGVIRYSGSPAARECGAGAAPSRLWSTADCVGR